MRVSIPLVLAAAGAAAGLALAQPSKGTVERIKVHGRSLEGNLVGDSPDRDVSVYLPPSYASGQSRRYPVIYYLHGFTDSDDKWFGLVKHWINLPETLDRAWAAAGAREAIVVMPNAFTAFAGSMYSSSATTGDWETFVARELVSYIDAHYRTLPRAASRGLAGHSMGGYGTLRVGLKNPETFSALYAMSPCCLAPPTAPGNANEEMRKRLTAIENKEQLIKADFMTKVVFASAAAWSPNPQNPPFFVDLPWTPTGEFRPEVLDRWQANAPLLAIDQYVGAIRGLRGLAIDSGDKDGNITKQSRELHAILDTYKLPHEFEIYDGDHLNRIAARIETKTVPFFSQRLDFAQK